MSSIGPLHPQIDVYRDEEIDGLISAGHYQPQLPLPKPLSDRSRISSIWPESPLNDHLHLFIGLQTELNFTSPSLLGTPPAVTRDLWPAVTVNVYAQANFGGLPALERNRISELGGTKPDYLMEFRTKLLLPHRIESDTVCFFKFTYHSSY